MSVSIDRVIDAIRDGKQLIGFQTTDFGTFVALQTQLAHSDPQDLGRPIISWDAEDGLLPVRDVLDSLPEATELRDAFGYIEKYQGGAIFLVDGNLLDLNEQAANIRPRLKQLVAKTAITKDLVVILASSVPLPVSLTRLVYWLGDEVETGTTQTIPTSKKVASQSLPWKEFRSLESINTPDWHTRIDALSYDDIRDIVQGEFHREPLERVNELRSELKQRFAQKDEIIDAITASAVAQVPCVLMGPPGTSKGHLIRSFCEGLGLTSGEQGKAGAEGNTRKYFEYQLTRFTTPEELFGPVHIQDLIDRQIYRRVTDGYLPSAHVAFLDELFKASSAILNTLLSLLNERVFYNEGTPQKVPLTTIFAASNEPPQDESLGALFDRFPIRINCPAVENDKLSELHSRAWQDSVDRHFSENRQGQRTVSCSNDLRLLKKVTYFIGGGREAPGQAAAFEKEFIQVFRMLRREASISDRSLALLYTYARSTALLAGRNVMTADDLGVFQHVVWGQEREFEGFFRQLKRNYKA